MPVAVVVGVVVVVVKVLIVVVCCYCCCFGSKYSREGNTVVVVIVIDDDDDDDDGDDDDDMEGVESSRRGCHVIGVLYVYCILSTLYCIRLFVSSFPLELVWERTERVVVVSWYRQEGVDIRFDFFHLIRSFCCSCHFG